jgi:hypothetical protein
MIIALLLVVVAGLVGLFMGVRKYYAAELRLQAMLNRGKPTKVSFWETLPNGSPRLLKH